jgi:hypothetical protein
VFRSGVLRSDVEVELMCAVSQFQVVGSARRGIELVDRVPVTGAECCRW